MNKQDQQKVNAHRNQTTISEFVKLETDAMLQEASGRTFSKKPNQQIKLKDNQNDNLLCASGGKCEGICREQHLYRVRIANPKAIAKGAIGVKSWTDPPNKCPSAYEK